MKTLLHLVVLPTALRVGTDPDTAGLADLWVPRRLVDLAQRISIQRRLGGFRLVKNGFPIREEYQDESGVGPEAFTEVVIHRGGIHIGADTEWGAIVQAEFDAAYQQGATYAFTRPNRLPRPLAADQHPDG